MTATITREVQWDMGHMLPDHLGGCYRPHGHRYRLELTVAGELVSAGPSRGMVCDFGDLKTVLTAVADRFDHRFAVCADDERCNDMLRAFNASDDLVLMSRPPTAENLVQNIVSIVGPRCDDLGVRPLSVRLWETPTCSTEWRWP